MTQILLIGVGFGINHLVTYKASREKVTTALKAGVSYIKDLWNSSSTYLNKNKK